MSDSGFPPCAVGFDFDHTLGMDNGLEVTAFYRLADALGRPLERGDVTAAAAIGDMLGQFRTAQLSLDEMVAAFVERIGIAGGVPAGDQFRQICYALVDELVTPVDGARELIATLHSHAIPTAILTNGWSPLQYFKIARALDYRGPILVSDELGTLKPDAAAFGKLIDVLGVPRERVWFVGDNPKTDIAGAQGAGLRGVWFDWEDVSYPVDAAPPDERIGHLSELPALLRGAVNRTENTRR